MDANEVIEAYVTDVALQLPRKQRSDVAFELRALLREELQDRSDAAGRPADAAMATEFLNAFGRPADVAARYRPALTIIDPADGYAFLRLSAVGLVILWIAGALRMRHQDIGGWELLGALGEWWGGTFLPSFVWPGLLVTGFGASAWARSRRANAPVWTPRAKDRIPGTRATLVLGVIGIVCGLYVLVEPRVVLDFIWAGHAAPQAYDALTYTDTFRTRQAPWLFALLALNVPLLVTVLVQGRWSGRMQQAYSILGLVLCAAMLWTVLDGPVFKTAASDAFVKLAMVVIIAWTLIAHGIQWFRTVRPRPMPN